MFLSLSRSDVSLADYGAAREFFEKNPHAEGFQGTYRHVFATKEDMVAMLAISAVYDKTAFDQRGLEAMLSKVDGSMEGASRSNATYTSLRHVTEESSTTGTTKRKKASKHV